MPLCQILWHEEKMASFEPRVSPVLTQNEDIWNFRGSRTLNNGKLIAMLEVFTMQLYQI